MLKRVAFLVLGSSFFGLGGIGIVVPGLPTTIFWILAALCYMKSSPRMYAYLINNRRFGPGIKLFIEERAISRKGKIVSIGSITVMTTATVIALDNLAARLSLAAVSLFGVAFIAMLRTADARGPAAAQQETEPPPVDPEGDGERRSPTGVEEVLARPHPPQAGAGEEPGGASPRG